MIFENVEFHNIAEARQLWNRSWQLQRVPETVRRHLNEGAQARCLAAANAEIRFVADGPVRLSLSCSGDSHFLVSHGSFLSPTVYPLNGSRLTYELEVPENLAALKPGVAAGMTFHPRVFRVLLPRQTICFFSIKGDNVRPPAPGEVPSLRYLAYGTSITEGGCATTPHLSYVAQTARRLNADLLNLGMSGSCQAEKEMADYIAGRDDWQIATLALSVNMMGFTAEEFGRRVDYAVNTVAGAHPDRPVACITILPYFSGLSTNHVDEEGKAEQFRQILRDVVARCPHRNVHLIEGRDLLDQVDGLSADMIHPSDFGMARMAENLAARLRPLLAGG